MRCTVITVSVFVFVVFCVVGFYRINKPTKEISLPEPGSNENWDIPLTLTEMLESGKYELAQKRSKVSPNVGNMTSYSGFFTVNKKCGSNLFFWFFPAQKDNWKDFPLLLWLQGGPGSSSMYGLFEELGPFSSSPDGLKDRQYSWNVENNLLFIDQPVGTGFSFTRKDCYPTNKTVVGKELYEAVKQFHMLFPNFQQNKFFISGESYGGHYVPALGYAIKKYNTTTNIPINLSAMLIGNGLMDPVLQIDYASYLYQHGFIDDIGLLDYHKTQSLFVQQVANGEYYNAFNTLLYLNINLFKKYVGKDMDTYYYLPDVPDPNKARQNWEKFVQTEEIRKVIHVGNVKYQAEGDEIYQALTEDVVLSVKQWVEELLEDYPIIFYNGQNDIICAYPMMINFIRSLNWSGRSQYLNATRNHWCVGQDMAGYYKGVHNLYDVLVRHAGHMVPAYQPLWAYTLVNSVTSGTPDNPLHALTQCTGSDIPTTRKQK